LSQSFELESLQKELDFHKGVRSGHEERLLKVMSEIEELSPRRKAARQKIETLEQDWERAQHDMRGELRQLEEKLDTVRRRRDEQKARITPRPLGLYEDLRPRKGGVAVAPIKAGACSSCRVALPGAVRSRTLDKDAVVQCPNCERILTPG
jgi:predicted  nucleic acid-binding Zn-ribbon protein